MQTKDFKGQDLRGKSFKNQDLTGADFSDCDLRGVDFSFANLTDARFCNARMGRLWKAEFSLVLLEISLGVLGGFIAYLSLYFFNFSLEKGFEFTGIGRTLNSSELLEPSPFLEVYITITTLLYSLLFSVSILKAINKKQFSYILSFLSLVLVIAAAMVMEGYSSSYSIGIIIGTIVVVFINGYKAIISIGYVFGATAVIFGLFILFSGQEDGAGAIAMGLAVPAATITGVSILALISSIRKFTRFISIGVAVTMCSTLPTHNIANIIGFVVFFVLGMMRLH